MQPYPALGSAPWTAFCIKQCFFGFGHQLKGYLKNQHPTFYKKKGAKNKIIEEKNACVLLEEKLQPTCKSERVKNVNSSLTI